jgi:hypothetical protein
MNFERGGSTLWKGYQPVESQLQIQDKENEEKGGAYVYICASSFLEDEDI